MANKHKIMISFVDESMLRWGGVSSWYILQSLRIDEQQMLEFLIDKKKMRRTCKLAWLLIEAVSDMKLEAVSDMKLRVANNDNNIIYIVDRDGKNIFRNFQIKTDAGNISFNGIWFNDEEIFSSRTIQKEELPPIVDSLRHAIAKEIPNKDGGKVKMIISKNIQVGDATIRWQRIYDSIVFLREDDTLIGHVEVVRPWLFYMFIPLYRVNKLRGIPVNSSRRAFKFLIKHCCEGGDYGY